MSNCEPAYPPGLPCDNVSHAPTPAPIPVESPVPTTADVGASLVDTGGFMSPWIALLIVALIVGGFLLWRLGR